VGSIFPLCLEPVTVLRSQRKGAAENASIAKKGELGGQGSWKKGEKSGHACCRPESAGRERAVNTNRHTADGKGKNGAVLGQDSVENRHKKVEYLSG